MWHQHIRGRAFLREQRHSNHNMILVGLEPTIPGSMGLEKVTTTSAWSKDKPGELLVSKQYRKGMLDQSNINSKEQKMNHVHT